MIYTAYIMTDTLKFIFVTALMYFVSRLRKENDSEGWVRINNDIFHAIFFWGGAWEYRPCEIVLAVAAEIGFVFGICLLPFHISDRVKVILFVVYIAVVVAALYASFIYECYIICKRRKKSHLADRYIRNLRRSRKWKK